MQETLAVASDYEKALKLAMRKLAMRNYPSFELSEVLEEAGASKSVVVQVIEECIKRGYVNDVAWAEAFARAQSAKKYGPQRILHKLRQMRCPEHLTSTILGQLAENDDQEEKIIRLLETTYRGRNLSDRKDREKTIAALMRKGYDLDTIFKTIRQHTEASG